MSAKRRQSARAPSWFWVAVQTLGAHTRSLVVTPLIMIVFVGGTYWGWQVLLRRGMHSGEYRLRAEAITIITPPPRWLHVEDIRAEVVRDASLDRPVSILEDALVERIALAFAAHPWVEAVTRVEKFYPARVEVSVLYRQPVAVVAIDGQLMPVDRQGVRLPSEQLSLVELRKFPLIQGMHMRRPAAAGLPWGDSRASGGALIASTIGVAWDRLKLAQIVPSHYPVRGEHDVYTYELVTRTGARISWGRQYLSENPAEPTAAQKANRIKQYAEKYGTLDGIVRQNLSPDARESPRTANTPGSENDRSR